VAVATRRPQHGRVVSVVVFDMKETLSDLAPMRSLPELAAQV
jgi:hypothetical protein